MLVAMGAMSRGAAWIVMTWCAVAQAEVRTSKAAKVSIDIPAAWKMDVKDDLMRGESADKAVALMFWVVESGDVKEATKKLDHELYQAIAKLKWEAPRKATINGLTAAYVDGHGYSVNKIVDLQVVVVGPTPSKKGVIVVAAVDHMKLEGHTAELDAIFKSLRPVK
jgi:hypothetical protein